MAEVLILLMSENDGRQWRENSGLSKEKTKRSQCYAIPLYQSFMLWISFYNLSPELAGTTREEGISLPDCFVCFVVSLLLLLSIDKEALPWEANRPIQHSDSLSCISDFQQWSTLEIKFNFMPVSKQVVHSVFALKISSGYDLVHS